MPKPTDPLDVKLLSKKFKGDFYTDLSSRLQYATDASAYREIPVAVALPKDNDDLRHLIELARANKTSLIARAAGTSLAGQVVGKGIVVDFSKYWNDIIELNPKERWVRIKPGVILDELNSFLKPHALFFGPETSTSNRCMLGGMVGNNSCGSHSMVYGSTRDHLLSVKIVLDDGNEYEFRALDNKEFDEKLLLKNREGDIYRHIFDLFSTTGIKQEIIDKFPKPSIKRRNTGYALDSLIQSSVFNAKAEVPFNFCDVIAGSEGTLGFITEIKLNLVDLPPKNRALLCIHLTDRNQAFKANLIALRYNPAAVELMDNVVLECTKHNIEQQRNRFFVKGDPGAILIVEIWGTTDEEIHGIAQKLEKEMLKSGFGYHFPLLFGDDMSRVWALRKAGLGVLSNIEGDAKPVSLIEDTAVDPVDLPDYMHDFEQILKKHKLKCVYHAHIGSGELHLRPVLNLKDNGDVELFRTLAFEVAHLVKKYRGSLSGEHGDGRLRGELIPLMVGPNVFHVMKELKHAFDPQNLFNPGKIIDTPPLNSHLRYERIPKTRHIDTIQNFDNTLGILRAIEKCNGSGDCRKTHNAGGTMCPSYMATRDEWNSTRARANILREFLANDHRKNPFDHQEIFDILDQCLSCKGCKSECPSNVDMAKLKAEFLHQWYKSHRIPLRTRLIGNISKINAMGSIAPKAYNWLIGQRFFKWGMDRIIGISPHREFPKLNPTPFKKWVKRNKSDINPDAPSLLLFVDEFTNYTDSHIGQKAYELLTFLGYNVEIAKITESGRAYISKGMLNSAKRIANANISYAKDHVSQATPLVGIEPSAILSFRDEYADLVSDNLRPNAQEISEHCLLFEEFFMREVQVGRITQNQFLDLPREIRFHGHCQQKAIASTKSTIAMLSFPKGYKVTEIPSGCCGMAGSFGFEKEHFELSMKVGELVLFPEIRKTAPETEISAAGTSCRQQITDGTGRKALHPIEIMWEAVRK